MESIENASQTLGYVGCESNTETYKNCQSLGCSDCKSTQWHTCTGRPLVTVAMRVKQRHSRISRPLVPLVAVFARVTLRHSQAGRPLVSVVAVAARVTQRHLQTGRPLVAVVVAVTQTFTNWHTLGCSSCKRHTRTGRTKEEKSGPPRCFGLKFHTCHVFNPARTVSKLVFQLLISGWLKFFKVSYQDFLDSYLLFPMNSVFQVLIITFWPVGRLELVLEIAWFKQT